MYFFFFNKVMHKNKAFMKTVNKKLLNKHTNHSYLLNWAKIEGSSVSEGAQMSQVSTTVSASQRVNFTATLVWKTESFPSLDLD